MRTYRVTKTVVTHETTVKATSKGDAIDKAIQFDMWKEVWTDESNKFTAVHVK